VTSLFAAQNNGQAQVGAERPPAGLGAFCRCLGAGKLTSTRTNGLGLEEEQGGGSAFGSLAIFCVTYFPRVLCIL
jgi:hypothetical protein